MKREITNAHIYYLFIYLFIYFKLNSCVNNNDNFMKQTCTYWKSLFLDIRHAWRKLNSTE